jgi:hypothetical protein
VHPVSIKVNRRAMILIQEAYPDLRALSESLSRPPRTSAADYSLRKRDVCAAPAVEIKRKLNMGS